MARARNASEIVEIVPDDPMETLRRCNGYYNCPKDDEGKRLGPLVGYAGQYEASDGTQKQWVGDIYANFAAAEEFPHVLRYYAKQMDVKLASVYDRIDVFCGAPLGGYDFAKMLGLVFDRRAIKAEKKVTALATANQREKSIVVFGRHQLKLGDRVAIVEDVCNNFSTTDQLIALVGQSGGKVTAITCLLNRSLIVDDWYELIVGDIRVRMVESKMTRVPVISLVRMPIPEYKQDDPEVADDIAAGNIVWKPKDEWERLKTGMAG